MTGGDFSGFLPDFVSDFLPVKSFPNVAATPLLLLFGVTGGEEDDGVRTVLPPSAFGLSLLIGGPPKKYADR